MGENGGLYNTLNNKERKFKKRKKRNGKYGAILGANVAEGLGDNGGEEWG